MASMLQIAKHATTEQAKLIVKDAGYIPEEKMGWCAMGCAKTARDILAEIATSNAAIAAAIRGEQPAEAEADFRARAECATTLDAIGKLVIESANAVCAAIDTLDEADLDKEVRMPWGAMYPLSTAMLLPASHMTYHDGQINYIQTLLGDDKFHWAEG